MKKILTFVIALVLIMAMWVPVYADPGGADPIAGIVDALGQLSVFGILGLLVVFVQVIVQMTKEAPFIKGIPTKLWAILISLCVCELALFIYGSWAGIIVLWYYVVLGIFAAFIVAYIAMYGWDALRELYLRYAKLKE